MSNIKGRQIGKITAEELKLIQDQENKVKSIVVEIGYQESRKHTQLHDLADTNEIINSNEKKLQDKYGHKDIDITTGEWKIRENVKKIKKYEKVQ